MWLKIITSVNDKEKPYIYLLLAEYNLKHFFFYSELDILQKKDTIKREKEKAGLFIKP